MNFVFVLGLLALLSLPAFAIWFHKRGGGMPFAFRVITAPVMIGIMMFCSFGYLASFEPMAHFNAWFFRVLYAGLGCSALFIAAECLRRRSGIGSALPTFRMRLFASRTLYFGIALLIFGAGPVLAIVVLSKFGVLSNPNPNPVGLGLLAVVSFYPSLALILAAILEAARPSSSTTILQRSI